MSVYVDEIRRYSSGQWCHMLADSLDELHEMADRIGLNRGRFQDKPRFPHYDLRPSKRKLALEAGAVEATTREIVRRRRR